MEGRMSKIIFRREKPPEAPERDLVDRLEREREPIKTRDAGYVDVFQDLAGGISGIIFNYASVLGRRR